MAGRRTTAGKKEKCKRSEEEDEKLSREAKAETYLMEEDEGV